MKGTGRLITATAGSANAAGMVAARAVAIGADMAVSTAMLGSVGGKAERTRDRNLITYLRVKPEQPQGLVWMVPQVGIDYTIESNTNWNIK